MIRIISILFFLFSVACGFNLSLEEKKLIEKYPLKCISTGEWAPFNLIENNKLTGIGLDYWTLIQKRLGIQGECKIAKSWIEVLQSIKNQSADLTVATQGTKERLGYALFSKPYGHYPIVIVTKNDAGFIDNVDLMKDKTIAVGKGYAVTEILNQHYPSLQLKHVGSIDEALSMVNEGKLFATIGVLPVIAYKLNKHGFANLKISGSIPQKFSVSIMIRKDYEMLLPLINRAIDSISKKEKNKIYKQWISIEVPKKIASKYFYTLLVSAAILFIFFSAWLYMLKREISKSDTITKRLQKLVTIDSLTSIYNRYMFDTTLDKEIELSKRHGHVFSLIFFDIDDFKLINDRYGHKVGDMILKELAELTKNSIRKSDTLCRWGGDEFIIILHNTRKEHAVELANNIDLAIKLYRFANAVQLNCSFGVCEFKEDDTHESIISRVDKNLYESKKKTIGKP
ncbi:MAG: diguanylate cyclase [Sulfurovum sp.]|nr:diguanylate cyclase [Sulfurovum sp.]